MTCNACLRGSWPHGCAFHNAKPCRCRSKWCSIECFEGFIASVTPWTLGMMFFFVHPHGAVDAAVRSWMKATLPQMEALEHTRTEAEVERKHHQVGGLMDSWTRRC